MKNRINLFKRKPKQDFISVNAPKIKRYLTGAGVVLFLFFIFLITKVLNLNSTHQDLLKKKETYLKYLLDEKDVEANMRYFKSKQTQVNTFFKEDAQFLPYYEVLKKSLEETSNNAILDTIEIDKTRTTRFIVQFKNSDDMLSFLRYVEAEDFLKNFLSLSLQSFNLNQLQSSKGKYQLELRGVFKELKTK
ncbi:MAG: hypothetical protein NTV98_04960 [Candidatus Roizmanbacteria bacterium]|nr:hypothetical protein [Candidatus Roizmanbacteria bacterium]